MESIRKNLFMCDLFKDTAEKSDSLMSNMSLICDELNGEESLFHFETNQKFLGSFPDSVLGKYSLT